MHDPSGVKIPPYPPFTQRGDTDLFPFVKGGREGFEGLPNRERICDSIYMSCIVNNRV